MSGPSRLRFHGVPSSTGAVQDRPPYGHYFRKIDGCDCDLGEFPRELDTRPSSNYHLRELTPTVRKLSVLGPPPEEEESCEVESIAGPPVVTDDVDTGPVHYRVRVTSRDLATRVRGRLRVQMFKATFQVNSFPPVDIGACGEAQLKGVDPTGESEELMAPTWVSLTPVSEPGFEPEQIQSGPGTGLWKHWIGWTGPSAKTHGVEQFSYVSSGDNGNPDDPWYYFANVVESISSIGADWMEVEIIEG